MQGASEKNKKHPKYNLLATDGVKERKAAGGVSQLKSIQLKCRRNGKLKRPQFSLTALGIPRGWSTFIELDLPLCKHFFGGFDSLEECSRLVNGILIGRIHLHCLVQKFPSGWSVGCTIGPGHHQIAFGPT